MKQDKQETAGTVERKRKATKVFSAKEKSQAVLSLWIGRRSASALMKELGIPWAVLNAWEKRALNGMLTALDPMGKQAAAGQPSLPARLEKLIEKTMKPVVVAEPVAAN